MNVSRHTSMWLVFLISAILFAFGTLLMYAESLSDGQITAVLAGVAIFGVANIGLLWRGLRRDHRVRNRVVGRLAEVREPISSYQEGYVFVHGELWKARLVTPQPLALDVGAWVRVVGQSGITLLVTPPGDGAYYADSPSL